MQSNNIYIGNTGAKRYTKIAYIKKNSNQIIVFLNNDFVLEIFEILSHYHHHNGI